MFRSRDLSIVQIKQFFTTFHTETHAEEKSRALDILLVKIQFESATAFYIGPAMHANQDLQQ